MSIKISSINKADRDEWLATCLKCSYATFFHTPYWCELFTNYKTSARKICFSDGRSAILPLTYQTVLKGLVKVYQSMPACTFGGWISSDVLEAQHCRLLLDYLMSLGNLLYRENPYDSILKSIELTKHLKTSHQQSRFRRDMTVFLKAPTVHTEKRYAKRHRAQ